MDQDSVATLPHLTSYVSRNVVQPAACNMRTFEMDAGRTETCTLTCASMHVQLSYKNKEQRSYVVTLMALASIQVEASLGSLVQLDS